MTEEKKPKAWGWYTKRELALMSPEERKKVFVKYQTPPENIETLLKQLVDGQGQILHELSEIRAQLMYQGDSK